MKKRLGIGVLVLSVVAIFIPFGSWITPIIALLSVFATGSGFRFGISAIIINMINLLTLSPHMWVIPVLLTILMTLQIIALIVLISRNKKTKKMV